MISQAGILSLITGTLFITAPLMASIKEDLPPLQTVSSVDLVRYMGDWYEIASFPQRFQKGCVASKAAYALRKDGDVDVLNQCRDKTLDGKIRMAKGKAWVTDSKSRAKLKVRFFWPFSGAYWIIDLCAGYEYAVVGHPNRNYLWILSRTPQMDPAVYDGILDRLKKQHYDISRLKKTLQPAR
jgi:apolipoprotein D and lipocalin family protein